MPKLKQLVGFRVKAARPLSFTLCGIRAAMAAISQNRSLAGYVRSWFPDVGHPCDSNYLKEMGMKKLILIRYVVALLCSRVAFADRVQDEMLEEKTK